MWRLLREPRGHQRRSSAIATLLLAISLGLVAPCHAAVVKEARSLLGTLVEITVIDPDESKALRAKDQAFAEIRRIEDLMSYYRPNSEVSRINAAPAGQEVRVSPEVFGLLDHAQTISCLTQGAFDITFAPLWELWGKCAKERRLPSSVELAQAKSSVDYRKVCLMRKTQEVKLMLPGMRINLGGIAKGYAVARAGRVLQDQGLDNYLVNIGGDILARGEGREGKGWRIGIQHPRRSGDLIGMLWIKDGCSLTSGDYERYFQIDGKRYHHIIDARSGYPAPGCSAVTILAPRLSHDYLPSVAVFLLGPDRGLALLQDRPEMAGLIITSEGRVLTTSNLSGFLEAPLPAHLDMTEAE